MLAALSLAGAVIVALLLPREKHFVRSEGLATSARQMLRHLKNPQLLATFAIGFGVLFNFIGIFTYVSFHLAGPPYFFSSTLLGAIFACYLVGTVVSPMTGWAIAQLGRRRLLLVIMAVWVFGVLLTLAPPVAHHRARPHSVRRLRHAGADHLDRLRGSDRQGRALVGGRALRHRVLCRRQHGRVPARPRLGAGGYPACVAMVIAVQAAMALIAALAYRRVTV